jgi:hypothetical protein
MNGCANKGVKKGRRHDGHPPLGGDEKEPGFLFMLHPLLISPFVYFLLAGI